MARKKRKRSRRELPHIARPVRGLHRPSPFTPSRPVLSAVADGRTYHPDRPLAFGIRRTPTFEAPSPRPGARPPIAANRIRFKNPRNVLVCRRRQARREVLMARGVGGSRVRRPRYNATSEISCR